MTRPEKVLPLTSLRFFAALAVVSAWRFGVGPHTRLWLRAFCDSWRDGPRFLF